MNNPSESGWTWHLPRFLGHYRGWLPDNGERKSGTYHNRHWFSDCEKGYFRDLGIVLPRLLCWSILQNRCCSESDSLCHSGGKGRIRRIGESHCNVARWRLPMFRCHYVLFPRIGRNGNLRFCSLHLRVYVGGPFHCFVGRRLCRW